PRVMFQHHGLAKANSKAKSLYIHNKTRGWRDTYVKIFRPCGGAAPGALQPPQGGSYLCARQGVVPGIAVRVACRSVGRSLHDPEARICSAGDAPEGRSYCVL